MEMEVAPSVVACPSAAVDRMEVVPFAAVDPFAVVVRTVQEVPPSVVAAPMAVVPSEACLEAFPAAVPAFLAEEAAAVVRRLVVCSLVQACFGWTKVPECFLVLAPPAVPLLPVAIWVVRESPNHLSLEELPMDSSCLERGWAQPSCSLEAQPSLVPEEWAGPMKPAGPLELVVPSEQEAPSELVVPSELEVPSEPVVS